MYKTLGVTGNREFKIPIEKRSLVFKKIKKVLQKFAQQGGQVIITGGAKGVDLWAAKIALHNGLTVHTYLPYPNYNKNENQLIVEKSAYVYTAMDKYAKQSFFIRNQEIVNNSDVILSVFSENQTSGGAYYTHNYAKKKNKKIIHIGFKGAQY